MFYLFLMFIQFSSARGSFFLRQQRAHKVTCRILFGFSLFFSTLRSSQGDYDDDDDDDDDDDAVDDDEDDDDDDDNLTAT